MANARNAATRRRNARTAVGLLTLCLIGPGAAQLTFHADAHTNSFTLKAPGLQQSFTRHFGGGRGGVAPQSASLLQPQPAEAQQLTQPQQFQHLQPLPQYQNAYQPQAQTYAAPQPPTAPGLNYAAPSAPPQQAFTSAQSRPTAGYTTLRQQIDQHQHQLQQQQEQLRQLQHHHQLGSGAGGGIGAVGGVAGGVVPSSSYADQVQATYANQHQQQQQYAQYQQQMLDQLYRTQPPSQHSMGALQQHLQTTASSGITPMTADQYANYLQRQQSHVQHQQHQQLQNQLQYYVGGSSRPYGAATESVRPDELNPNISAFSSPTTVAPDGSTERVVSVQYSPSNKVSHTKYTSANLSYNY